MKAMKKQARITGILYLIVILCAGFSQGAVREVVYVVNDATATAQNILGNSTLFKWGLITDMIAFMTDIAISVLLYQLLKPVHRTVALISSGFRLIAHPAIAGVNLLNHFGAMRVLQSPALSEQFLTSQLYDFSLMFMEIHHMGYLIAGAFFGTHCLLLGYLLFKSAEFPRIFGFLLVAAAFGYLIESFGFPFYPEMQSTFALIVGVTAGIGEVSFCLYLMIKGNKTAT